MHLNRAIVHVVLINYNKDMILPFILIFGVFQFDIYIFVTIIQPHNMEDFKRKYISFLNETLDGRHLIVTYNFLIFNN